MIEDIKEFINKCSKRIIAKNGKFIKPKSKIIVTKDPSERIVIDGWESDINIKNITHYKWVIDIAHFSKFLMSIPVFNNDAQNINYIGIPKIVQSDNGKEYNNATINNFLKNNNIEHLNSSPRQPQINSVVEVINKEIRKNILLNFNLIDDDITFKNLIIDCVNIHNNNVHTITGFKPSFLIKNTDKEIYDTVIENIKKKYKIAVKYDDENYILKEGDHLLTLGGPYKAVKI